MTPTLPTPSATHSRPSEKFDPRRSGCAQAVEFFLILMLLCAGGFVGNDDTDDVAAPIPQDGNAALGKLPVLAGVKPAPTTTTTTTAPPVPATATPPLAPQQPVSQQQAAPPPPQAPSCGYTGSISVSGGNVGSLPPSGGNYTANGPSSISISGPPVCGQHYRLEWRADHPGGGFHRGSDCKFDGFSTQIPSQNGSAVSVQILLPPNACG